MPVYFSCRSYRRAQGVALVASTAVLLSGCWAPPSANVRPSGEPRLVADRVEVEPVADSARVESVDRAARTVVLNISGVPQRTYKVGRGVRHWGEIRTGDRVHVTIKEILAVYVGLPGLPQNARVLAVDPSYRLLTLQYPSGATEIFKVRLHTRMKDIAAGDSVAIHPIEVTELRVR